MGIADYVVVMPEETDRALEALGDAVVHTQEQLERVLARVHALKEGRAQGRSYSDLVSGEQRPLLVERLTEVLDELSAAGAAFRRAEARVLHDHGLSQETIAELFGVTRQRVSVLLQPAPARRSGAPG